MENVKKSRLLLFSLSFASTNYFSNHFEVLSEKYQVDVVNVDKAPIINMIYNRRSFLSLPFEVIVFFFYLIKYKPDIIMTAGPKLGLIFSTICIFLPIKHVHWFTGQVWGASVNPKRTISYWVDYIIYNLSDILYCDGLSQSKFIQSHFGYRRDVFVPKNGSINGLNGKFVPRFRERKSSGKLKVCFIGRKAKGKGLELIPDIAKAFDGNDVEFLLAGPEDLSFPNYTEWKIDTNKICNNIVYIDDYVEPLDILKDSDVLILPSEREGFGSIVIEAQSCGVVPICSSVYGLKDAFVNGVTGISCNTIDDYISALNYLRSEEIYLSFSENASEFSSRFTYDNFSLDLKDVYVVSGIL